MVNLADGFLLQASRNPHRIAFSLDGSEQTYAELAVAAQRWRHYLMTMIREQTPRYSVVGTIVAWSGFNDVRLAALYLACAQSGYCLALLDPTWPASTLKAVLDDLSPLCVITPDSPAQPLGGAEAVLSNSACENDFFLLGFTSGSTGKPKAFVRRQISWINTFKHARVEFPAARIVCAPGPLSHGLSFYAMAETLHRGGTFVSFGQFDAPNVLCSLRQHSTETLVVVPTMLRMLTDCIDKDALAHQPQLALSQVISAGAKLSASITTSVRSCWPGASLSEYYGASELSFVSVLHSSIASSKGSDTSVGRAFDGVEICIRDAQGGELGCGQRGEVFVRSAMLADGYFDTQCGITPLRMHANSVSVGDIGSLDESGCLHLFDRQDNMIISGGLNVYPAQVQAVLEAHVDVQEAVVIGCKNDYWGQQVAAVLRLMPGVELSRMDFAQFCRQHLSPHQIPRQVRIVRDWPLTSSGKIAMLRLAQQLAQEGAHGDSSEGDLQLGYLDD